MDYKYTYSKQLFFYKGYIIIFQIIIFIIMIVKIELFFQILPKFIFLILCELFLTLVVNFWTNITTTKEGLQIGFYLRKILIPWVDVVGIERVNTPKVFFTNDYLWYIEAKNLPIFYRFYGLFFAYKWFPCIIIFIGLENIDQLISEIKSHMIVNGPITG